MGLFKSYSGYTVLQNEIFTLGLSLKAIGLYAYIENKPDGWDFSISGISTQVKDGKDSIRSSIQELEDVGLLERIQKRSNDGKFGAGDWLIHSQPVFKKQVAEKPMAENPTTEKHTQVITNKVNKNINNNIYINTPENLFEEKPKKYPTLDSITEQDFLDISEQYQVSVEAIRGIYQEMNDWMEIKGKKQSYYKNYKLALMKWVRNSLQKIKMDLVKGKNYDKRQVFSLD